MNTKKIFSFVSLWFFLICFFLLSTIIFGVFGYYIIYYIDSFFYVPQIILKDCLEFAFMYAGCVLGWIINFEIYKILREDESLNLP